MSDLRFPVLFLPHLDNYFENGAEYGITGPNVGKLFDLLQRYRLQLRMMGIIFHEKWKSREIIEN
jgi:hypothetical protein